LWCNQTRRLPTTSGDLDFINKETKHDQTFTGDWDETRCLPTSKDDVYRHQKNDQTFTDDWGENPMFTDTETMVFTDTKQRNTRGCWHDTYRYHKNDILDMSRQG
jgi:hypothetical protein